MIEFNIGKQFSDEPLGSFIAGSGEFSGEAFRERYILKMLAELKVNEKINFILDDVEFGYSAAFLQEAFGGIVTYGYFTAEELKKKICFSCNKFQSYEFYAEKIYGYIDRAEFDSKEYIPT